MFEEKLEQFSTIRHCEILADQMKTINLLEINYDIFQQKLDELQEAYRELDDYELKYKELISSSSSADQLMLQIIRMTIQHINKCHQEYLDNKWKKNYSTVSTTSTMSSFSLSVPTTPVSNDTMMSSSYSSASSLDETSSLLTPLTTIDAYSYADLKNDRNQFANNYDADWYLVVLINMTGKYLDDKLDDLVILENNNNDGDGDNNRSVENSSQVEVIKDLFKEIEKLKDLFVE
ncbi:3155_t:CDS:2 [Entrophospora sp. SA101]|nr:3155_t:CDS:2 [Entrophospora sp. SA101]CAJ0890030.1 1295_t:CDS:2 [Entrophospora sp. SA101]